MKILSFCFCFFTTTLLQAQLTKYVNPFIGTGGTGHTFPGATTPFAMVQLSPDTRIDGSWEGCSGYHYSDSIIHGFSHTHLSGTGVSDYGDIAFMPYFSKSDEYESLIEKSITSKFSHKNEKANAGYYSVVLDDFPVKIELTATTRSGFQRYTFNDDGYGYVVMNLQHRDKLLLGKINKVNTQMYKGIRVSEAWAKRQELYYGFKVNVKPIKCDIVSTTENDYRVILKYKVVKGTQILIKTGISTVDEDAALNNLQIENPSWNFEKTKLQAQENWEKELKKIEVKTSPQPSPKEREQKTIFYTALYHTMIHPSIMNDVDGRYKGRDGKIHKAQGFNYYTVFSLWDTHRALHPLLNIIDKKRSHDFVITFLKQYEQSGRLPMWEFWNNETDCMIGFHSVSVILDAFRKQVITKDELQQLWPAVKTEALSNRFGLDKFREKGFLSVGDESESVSKTAEYSYDMWCVSEIAMELNLNEDEKFFRKYENTWQELKNSKTGFLQPRKNGNWLQNFNPYEVNNNYTEANAWQYSFFAPQNTYPNERLLDSLFIAKNVTTGRTQVDITGLIGQYAHGNEPSHNYIYLLKNENRITYLKQVIDSFYTNKPDGLIGNEDCGQMSAWYVMSALGFYQTCPGNLELTVGTPAFNNIKIRKDSSNFFSIKKLNIESKNQYKYLLSKKDFRRDSMNILKDKIHLDILLNKNLTTIYENKNGIEMGKSNMSIEDVFTQAPIIKANTDKPFIDSVKIKLGEDILFKYNDDKIFYSLNNSSFKVYDSPFYIYNNTIIKAYSAGESDTSNQSIAQYYKRPNNYSIQLNCKYNKQYTADGDDGIIDGQEGYLDWRKGGWQGYQSQDFEAIIDMKKITSFDEISANFLQDTRSWILFPTKVEFYISDDNINFKLLAFENNKIEANNYQIQTQKFSPFMVERSSEPTFNKEKNEGKHKARFIKIKAYNFGVLPKWHQGFGGDAFIFIDEIEVK